MRRFTLLTSLTFASLALVGWAYNASSKYGAASTTPNSDTARMDELIAVIVAREQSSVQHTNVDSQSRRASVTLQAPVPPLVLGRERYLQLMKASFIKDVCPEVQQSEAFDDGWLLAVVIIDDEGTKVLQADLSRKICASQVVVSNNDAMKEYVATASANFEAEASGLLTVKSRIDLNAKRAFLILTLTAGKSWTSSPDQDEEYQQNLIDESCDHPLVEIPFDDGWKFAMFVNDIGGTTISHFELSQEICSAKDVKRDTR